MSIFRKKFKKFIRNKNIIRNIYRIQPCDSVICGYFCTGFIDFMLKGKSLLDYAKLVSPDDYEENDKKILQIIGGKYRNFEKPKI